MVKYKINYKDSSTMEYKGTVIIEIAENENIHTYLKDDYLQDLIVSSCSRLGNYNRD